MISLTISEVDAVNRVFDFASDNIVKLKKLIETTQAEHFQQILSLITSRRVWTTGMGKCSHTARKAAATFSCNKIAAAFLHAGECLHGDLGAIQPGDVLLAFSNSGQTDEVLMVVEKAKQIGASIILITGCSDSIIARKSDIVFSYDRVQEACPLGLTPTTSIIVMMILIDCLAMAAQVRMGLTLEEFARNHHSGYVGEALRQRIKDARVDIHD